MRSKLVLALCILFSCATAFANAGEFVNIPIGKVPPPNKSLIGNANSAAQVEKLMEIVRVELN